jgi:hypothetical protein
MGTTKKKIDNDILTFLAILKEGIYKEALTTKEVEPIDQILDWEYIFKIATRNNVLMIMYPGVAKRKDNYHIPSSILDNWDHITKRNIFLELNKYMAIRRMLPKAEEAGIKLVLFKGIILANLYPQYALRNTFDTDIFVYERDREKMVKLLEDLGYKKNLQHSKEMVPVYISEEMHHVIELHFSLYEDYKGRKIDIINKMDLVREESLIELDICGLNIVTLGYEQHLIYQMFHIIKHFSMEAVGIRYLTDITLYINAYRKYIDFSDFWKKMEELGFSKFCYVYFKLCIQYFDMNADIIEGIDNIDDSGKEELLLDIISRGLLFESKTASWQILGIMTPYLVGEESIPKSKIRRKIKVLFPSRKALPDKLSYAKKYCFLLPIAWIHKMIDFVIRYKKFNKDNHDWYNANQKLTTAEYRLNLMDILGLVKEE